MSLLLCFGGKFNLFAVDVPWTAGAGTVPNDGNIYYIDSTVTLTLDLTINGTLEIWQGGTLNTGNFRVWNNNTLTVSCGTFNRQGTNIFVNGNTAPGFINIVCGTFNLDGGFIYNGYTSDGTITITGGTFNLQSGGTLWNGAGSRGDVDLMVGDFNHTGGELHNGRESTGYVTITGGQYLLTGGALQNGHGQLGYLTLSGGTFDLRSGGAFYNAYSSTGNMTMDGGVFRLTDGDHVNGDGTEQTGNITISGGCFIIDAGSIRLGHGVSNFSFFGADLDSDDGPIVDGDFTIPAGEAMIIPGDSCLYLEDDAALTVDGDFTLSGTLENRGDLTTNGTFDNNGTFTNDTTGIFTNNDLFINDGQFYNLGIFINNGQFINNQTYINTGQEYIFWDPEETYLIPPDYAPYVFNSTVTLTDNLLITGTLILWSDAEIYTGIYTITNDATLTLSGGLLWITQGCLYNDGLLTISSGTLTNSGCLVNDGTITNSDTLNNLYTFTNNNIFANDGMFLNELSFTNYATVIEQVDMTGTGTWYEEWTVADEGYTIPNDGRVYFLDYSTSLGANLTNNGIFEVWPNGSLTVGSPRDLRNNKIVRIKGGTVTISSGGEFYNGYAAGVTADVFISGGIVTLSGGNFLNGHTTNGIGRTFVQTGGSIVLTSGNWFNPGANNTTGLLTLNGGSFSISGGVYQGPADVTRNGDVVINSGTVSVSGGIFYNSPSSCNGTVTVYDGGTFAVSGGSYYSDFLATATGDIFVYGGAVNVSGGFFYNGRQGEGRITVTSGSLVTSAGTFYNGDTNGSLASIRIEGGTFTQQMDNFFNGNDVGSQGFIYGVGGTIDLDDGTITNGASGGDGSLTVSSGTLKFGRGSLVKGGGGTSNVSIFGADLSGDASPLTKGYLNLASDDVMAIPSNGILMIDADATLTNDGLLSNTGTLHNTGTFDNNATFTNNNWFINDGYFQNDGIFTNTGVFDNNETFTNNNIFINKGVFNNTSPFYNNGLYYELWEPDVDGYTIPDDDIIYFIESYVTLTQDLIVSGTFEIWPGALLDIDGYTLSNNGIFTNSGGLENHGTIVNNSFLDNEGTFTNFNLFINNDLFTNNGEFYNFGVFFNEGQFVGDITGAPGEFYTPWEFDETYIIPDDGLLYYLNTTFTLTDDLLISGSFIILSDGELYTSTYSLTNDLFLTISGGLLWINQDGGCLINNGTLTNSGVISNYYTFTNAGIFDNNGVFLNEHSFTNSNIVIENVDMSGTGTWYERWEVGDEGYTIPRDGRVYYLDYPATLGAHFTNNGIFSIFPGGDLNNAAAYNIQNNNTLNITGTLTVADGTGQFRNAFDANSTATVRINGGGFLELYDRSFNGFGSNSNATIIVNQGGLFSQQNELFYSPQDGVDATGYVIVNGGTFDFSGGSIRHGFDSGDTGYIIINGGSFLSNPSSTFSNGTIGFGSIQVNGGRFLHTSGQFFNGTAGLGIIVINDGGVFSFVAPDRDFFNSAGASSVGRVTVNDGGRFVFAGRDFYNSQNSGSQGFFTILGGTLDLQSGQIKQAENSGAEGYLTIHRGRLELGNVDIIGGSGDSYTYLFTDTIFQDIINGYLNVSNSENVSIPLNSSIVIESVSTLTNDGILTNTGSLTNTGTIDNNNIFTNNNLFTNDGYFVNDGIFTNTGIFDNNETFTNNNIFINKGVFNNTSPFYNNGLYYELWEPDVEGYVIPGDNIIYFIEDYITLGADLTINGSFMIWGGGTLDTDGYTISNDGLLTLSCGDLIVAQAGVLDNNLDGTITISCGTLTNEGLFENYGTFENNSFFINNGTFNDFGTTINNNIFLTFWDPAEDGYVIPVDSNGISYAIDEYVALEADLVINGSLVILENGTLDTNGYTVSVHGSLSVDQGLLFVDPDGLVDNNSILVVEAGCLTNSGKLLNDRLFTNQDCFENYGTFTNNMSFDNQGTFTNFNLLANLYTFTNVGIFDNSGTFLNEHSFTNSNIVIENVDMSGTGTWYEQWEASDEGYTIPNDGRIYYLDYPATLGALLTNNGIFEVWSGGDLNSGSYDVYNNNTINITGTLTIAGSHYFRNAANASGVAKVTVNRGGFFEMLGFAFYNGYGSSSNGTVIVNDGGNFTHLSGVFQNPLSSSGGTGNIIVNGGLFNFNGTRIDGADNSFDMSNITINGGVFISNPTSYSWLARFGTGYITINGGTFLHVANELRMSVSGVPAEIQVNTGGSFIHSGGTVIVAYQAFPNNAKILLTGGTYHLLSGAKIINGRDSGKGNISVTGGTFNLSGGEIEQGFSPGIEGIITVASGTLVIGGVDIYEGSGTSNVSFFGSDIAQDIVNGYVSIPSSETLSIPLGSTMTLENIATLTNDGVLINTGSLSNTGTIDNNTIFVNNNLFTNDGYFVNDGFFTNTGIFDNNETFTNNNIFVSRGGTFNNTSPFYNNGFYYELWRPTIDGYVIPDEEKIYFIDEYVTLGADLTIDGELMIWGGATLDTNGYTISNDGLLTLSCGELIIASDGLLDNRPDGTLTVSCGTLTNYGELLNDGLFANSGTVDNRGTFTNRDQFTSFNDFTNNELFVNDGIFSNRGTFDNSETFTNQNLFYNHDDFVNNDRFANDGTFGNSGDFENRGIFVNNYDNLFINDSGFINNGTLTNSGTFDNNGTFTNNTLFVNEEWFSNDGEFYNYGDFVNNGQFVGDFTDNQGLLYIRWDPTKTYIIPPNGFAYYLDSVWMLTDDLLISGTLAIIANGELYTSTYTITNDANLTVSGGVLWINRLGSEQGFLHNNGSTNVLDGILANSGEVLNDGTFTNDDVFDNYVTFGNAGTFDNNNLFTNFDLFINNGGMINDGMLTNSGTLDNNQTFTNWGLFTNDLLFINDGEFYNYGTFINIDQFIGNITLQAGTYYIRWDHESTYIIPADGLAYFTDEIITLTDDLLVSGTLNIFSDGELYTSTYTITNNANLFLSGGLLWINELGDERGYLYSDGILGIASGTLSNSGILLSDGTLSNSDQLENFYTATSRGIFWHSGTFQNDGIFTNTGIRYEIGDVVGTGTWYEQWEGDQDGYTIPRDGRTYYLDYPTTLGADFTNNGIFEIWPGGDLNNGALYHIQNNHTINITGTLTIADGSGEFRNALDAGSTATVAIGAGGLFETYETFYNGYGSGSNGTLLVNQYAMFEQYAQSFYNPRNGASATGNLFINEGTLRFQGSIFASSFLTDDVGYVVMNGGLFLASPTGYLANGLIGRASMVLNGGTYRQTSGILYSGWRDVSSILINDGSLFEYAAAGNDFYNGGFSGGLGIVRINTGGTFVLSAGELYNGYLTDGIGFITVAGGTFQLNGGDVINGFFTGAEGSLTVESGTLDLRSGDIRQGSGTGYTYLFTDTLAQDITNGFLQIQSGENISIPAGSTLIIDDTAKLLNESVFSNTGTLLNDGIFTNTGVFDNNETFTNNNIFINKWLFNNTGQFYNNGLYYELWRPTLDGYVIPDDESIYFIEDYVTLGADLTIDGTFVIWTGGTLDTNGYTISNDGFFTLSCGDLLVDSDGLLDNKLNATLMVLCGTVTNDGTITSSGYFENNGTVINNGRLENTSTGTLVNNGSFIGDGVFVGVVTQNNGTFQVQWNPDDGYVIPDNGATYYLNTTFTLADDLLISGSFEIWSDGKLYTSTYSLTNDLSLTISGGLLWINDGGRLLNNGTLTNSGALNNFYTFTNAGVFENSGTFLNEHSFTNSNIVIENVDMSGTGTWYEQWEVGDEGHTIPRDGRIYYLDYPATLGAHFTNNGIFEIWSGGDLDNDALYTVSNNNTINITGTLTIANGAGIFQNASDANSTATVRIGAGGIIEIEELFYNGYGANSNGSLYVNEGGTFHQVFQRFKNPRASTGATGNLFINGGTFLLPALSFDGGTIAGDVGFIVMNGGLFLATPPNPTGRVIIIANGSGSFVINGGTYRQTSGLFRNSWMGTGSVIINGGGRFEYGDPTQFFDNGGSVNGVGNIRINTGGTFVFSDGDLFNGRNSGSKGFITVAGGTFELRGGEVTNGVSVGSEGNFVLESGIFDLGAGSMNVGSGSGAVYLFTDTISQDITNGYLHVLSSETVSIPLNSSIVIESVSTLTNDGLLVNTGELSSSGTIDNNNLFTNNNLFINDGYFVNDGIFTNTGIFDNNETFTNNNIFINKGVFNNTSPFYNNGLYYDLWEPDVEGYTIPDDNIIYFIEDYVTLGADLTIDGTFMIWTGGTLDTDDNTIINDGMLTISCGTLLINVDGVLDNKLDGTVTLSCGTITNNGMFLNAGTFINNGTFQNNPVIESWDFATDGYIIPDDGNWYYIETSQTLTTDLTINGTLYVLGGGELNTSSYSIFNNNTLAVTGGLVTVQAIGALFNGYNAGYSYAGFVNVTTGTLILETSGVIYSGNDIDGIINLTGGTIYQSGGVFYNGYANESTLTISGGTLDLINGDFVNGEGAAGTVNLLAGTLNQDGAIFYNGSDSDGNLTVDGGTFNLSSGTIINGETVGATGNVTISCGQFVLDNGDITAGPGTSNTIIYGVTIPNLIDGDLDIVMGQTMTISAGCSLIIDDDGILTNSGLLDNNGTITNFSFLVNGITGTFINDNLILNHGTIINLGILENYGLIGIYWDPFQHDYLIPGDPDGLVYIIDSYMTLTENLFIQGTLSIWNNGTLDTNGFGIYSDGTLTNSGTFDNSGLYLNNGGFYDAGTTINTGIFATEWYPADDGYVIPVDPQGFVYVVDEYTTMTHDLLVSGTLVIWQDGTLDTNGYTVSLDGALTVSGGQLLNDGILINRGTFVDNGIFINNNLFYDEWSSVQDGDIIPVDPDGRIYFIDDLVALDTNLLIDGSFEIWTTGTLINNFVIDNEGLFENYGTLTNNLLFINNGTFNNFGTFYNNGVYGTEWDSGDDGYVVPVEPDDLTYFIDEYITLTQDLVINGSLFIWHNGTLDTNGYTTSIDGVLSVSGGSLINTGTIDNDGLLDNDGTFTNYGYLINMGELINDVLMINQVTGTFDNYEDFTNNGTFINYGLFNNFDLFTNPGTFTNEGTFNGEIYVEWDPESTYIIPDDGFVWFIDSAITLTSDLTICGTLRLRPGAVLSISDEFIEVCNNGRFEVYDGVVTISDGGSFYNGCCDDCCNTTTGRVIVDGGTFNLINGTFVNSYISTATGIVTVRSGLFNISGGVFVNGFDTYSSGTVELVGGEFALSGGTLYNGYGSSALGTVHVSSGILTFSDGIFHNAYGSSTGNLTVESGTLALAGDATTNAQVELGDGTHQVTIFGATISYLFDSRLIVPAGQVMTIPSNGELLLAPDGVLSIYGDVINNGTLTHFGTIYLHDNGILANNNIFINNGAILELSQEVVRVQEGRRGLIPNGMDVTVPEWQRWAIEGDYLNRSDGSLEIYGAVYTYSSLRNGDACNPSSLTVHFPGLIALLDGSLENSSTSTITVESGGSLYSYYGFVANDGRLHIEQGAQFDSVRGSLPIIFTIDAGGVFTDKREITLDRNLDLDATWTITERVTINGDCHEITLRTNGEIVIDSGASLALEDITFNNISGNKIRCLDETATLSIDNVIWAQDGDYSFTTGRVDVLGDWFIKSNDESTHQFSYTSAQTGAIAARSTIYVTDGMTFELGNSFVFADKTSAIWLQDSTLQIPSSGIMLTTGKLRASDGSTIAIDTVYSVTLGDGIWIGSDFSIEIEGGACLTIDGLLYYNNVVPEDRIVFVKNLSALRVAQPSGLTAVRSLALHDGTISLPAPGYLATLGGAQIRQDDMINSYDSPYANYLVTGTVQSSLEYVVVDNGFVEVRSGRTTTPFRFTPGTSMVRGAGILASDLSLENESSTLNIALDSDLNGDITLNGGAVSLGTHLNFVGDKTLVGAGTVVLNSNRFSFGTSRQETDHEIYWDMSSQVELNAKMSLSGTWTFSGVGRLQGNGNILDITTSGRLVIDNDATLYLTDIIIKGLGDGHGDLLFMNDNSRVIMSNVGLVLSNNYTVTIGGVSVEGPTVWFMDSYDWTFDQLASLTVDGTVLWKDSLDKATSGEIIFGTPQANYLSLLNSGTIRGVGVAWIESDTTLLGQQIDQIEDDIAILFSYLGSIDHGPSNIFFDVNTTMSYNIYLGPQHKMYLQSDLALNGSTWYIHFSRASEPLFLIDPGVTVTLENIVLKDFLPEYVSFGDSQSELVFGNNVTIELADDMTLSRQWLFLGDCTIKGFGKTLSLAQNGILDVSASSTLMLDDVALANLGLFPDNLRCRANDSMLVLKDSELVLASDYTFSSGSIVFTHEVRVTGAGVFAYSSVMASTIDAASQLIFDIGTTFSYAPQTANRDLLVMTDRTSRLHLNGCMLYSTPTGLRLTGGVVLFDNLVTLSADGQVASEAVAFDDVAIDILAGAQVEAYGYIDIP